MARRRELSPLSAKTPATMVQRQAERLVGMPLSLDRTERLGPLGQVWAMREHARKLREKPEVQTDFRLFATKLCYTKDEAAGGAVALIPDWDYLWEMADACMRFSPVMIDKSRRTLVTWTLCALDLFIVSGGLDMEGRWAALMPSESNPNGHNRKVVILSQFLEGEGGSQDFLGRLKFMVDQIQERGLYKLWPGFPEWDWRLDRGTASNGGVVSAVPQGANKVRGSGITAIHAEELSFMSEARETVMQALQTLRPHGHFYSATTAAAGTFAASIYHEKLREHDPSYG